MYAQIVKNIKPDFAVVDPVWPYGGSIDGVSLAQKNWNLIVRPTNTVLLTGSGSGSRAITPAACHMRTREYKQAIAAIPTLVQSLPRITFILKPTPVLSLTYHFPYARWLQYQHSITTDIPTLTPHSLTQRSWLPRTCACPWSHPVHTDAGVVVVVRARVWKGWGYVRAKLEHVSARVGMRRQACRDGCEIRITFTIWFEFPYSFLCI